MPRLSLSLPSELGSDTVTEHPPDGSVEAGAESDRHGEDAGSRGRKTEREMAPFEPAMLALSVQAEAGAENRQTASSRFARWFVCWAHSEG